MIVHYLVIWCQGKNFNTRTETPMDLEVDGRDLATAEDRTNAIKLDLNEVYNISAEEISLINVCRL